MGNIVNRVFDSSGPEGKVRGTPQQIIDKYMILARDAQLSNDRVAAENFLQHAEHYTRMLGEAQREMQREADSRREQNEGGSNGFRDNRDRPRREPEEAEPAPAFYTPEPPRGGTAAATDVIDFAGDDDGEASVLVDTPESRPEPQAPAPQPIAPQAAQPAPVPPAPVQPMAPAAEQPRSQPRSPRLPRRAERSMEPQPAPEAQDAGQPAPDQEGDGARPARNTRRRSSPRKPKAQNAETTPDEAPVGD